MINGNLEVRQWDGEEWPEKRISLSSGNHAVMISPRYADIEESKKDAAFIAKCVNHYFDNVIMIELLNENDIDYDKLIALLGK